METAFLKGFLAEIYLSIIIFCQLLLNTNFINKTKFNYPILYKETHSQNIIFFFTLIFLLINSKINGIFPNLLLINNDGTLVDGFYNTSWNTGSSITLATNTWVNIQVTWNGTDLKTYLNTILLGTTQPGGTAARSCSSRPCSARGCR